MKEVEWDFDRAMEVIGYGTTWRPPVQGLTDIPDDAQPGESFFDLKAHDVLKETRVWICVAEGEVMQSEFSIGPKCPHCGK